MENTYHPCEVVLEFAGSDHLFRLPAKMLAELQLKCDAGIGLIWKRLITHEYSFHDLREIVRCGLVGGAMSEAMADADKISPHKAKALVDLYVDELPIVTWHSLALAIMSAAMNGYEASDGKKTEAAGETDGSTLPPSMEPVSPEDLPPAPSPT